MERAHIVLAAQRGERVPAIAARLGLAEMTARLWLKRFDAEGLAGLADAPRFGAFRPVTGEALTMPYDCRTVANFAAFLGARRGVTARRRGAGVRDLDNLSTHRAPDVLLFSLAHPR